jgi:hypothetical protein
MIGFLRFSLKNFGSFLSIAKQCLKTNHRNHNNQRQKNENIIVIFYWFTVFLCEINRWLLRKGFLDADLYDFI